MAKSVGKEILKKKVIVNGGVIVEMKIWQVPVSSKQKDGVRYSLYAVLNGKILVGYDNHHPKGHHKHIGGKELPYDFETIEQLRNDFLSDLEAEMAKVEQ